MRSMLRFEASQMGVAGCHDDVDLYVSYGRGKAHLKVDGENTEKQSEYLQSSGLVVWMGNDDIDLIRGSGSTRRRYLDFLCSQIDPSYRSALSRYRRALKARNVLLKERSDRASELRAYAELLITHGDYITQVRQQTVESLAPIVGLAQAAVSDRDEPVELVYQSGCNHNMRDAIENSRESEIRQRQCVVGPHRDDVVIHLNGMPANEFASEGQQRTLAVALKLAQGDLIQKKLQRSPMYLLDDVFGELDPGRRQALMAYLPEHAQKFITTTHIDWMQGDCSTWAKFRVDAGSVHTL